MTSSAIDSAAARLPADWRDLLALTKPRVMSLVVFTALCGLLAAPVTIPFALALSAILCIALAAGACGALNQWYEAELDKKMRRTAQRPLPAGRMDRQSALHFGIGLGVFQAVARGTFEHDRAHHDRTRVHRDRAREALGGRERLVHVGIERRAHGGNSRKALVLEHRAQLRVPFNSAFTPEPVRERLRIRI